MAAEQIGIAGYAAQLKPFYSKKLLTTFRQKNVFTKFGIKESIPAGGGKNLEKRRFEAIATSTTALTEGSAPAETNGTWTNATATVSQYGQWLRLTDVNTTQAFDKIVPANVENLSKTMAETLDTLTRDVLVAGTNVQFASTAASRGAITASHYLTLAELREALRTLKNANAEPSAEAGNRFAVLLGPKAMFDLQSDSELINIYMYGGERGSGNEIWDASFSTLPYGMRAFETTNVKVFTAAGLSGAQGAVDVHTTLVVAEEAYMVVDYEAMPAQVIVTPPIGGPADPLKQITVVGYKAAHGAAILNQSLMVRIEHTVRP